MTRRRRRARSQARRNEATYGSELVLHDDSAQEVARLLEATAKLADRKLAPNTRRAYNQAWKLFTAWAISKRLHVLPAEPATLAMFLAHMEQEGYTFSTIDQALWAIDKAHRVAGEPSPRTPQVMEVREGIQRKIGKAQKGKLPVLQPLLTSMVTSQPIDSLIGIRNRCLFLLDWFGAFRRSELVALDYEDIRFVPEGMEITIRWSKTDQKGESRKIGIPREEKLDPVSTTQVWLAASSITSGALLRGLSPQGSLLGRLSADRVARLIKEAISKAGVDSTNYSSHSMRAGFVTAAARAGKSELAVRQQTGHTNLDMLRRYYRDAELFTNSPAKGLF